MSKKYDPQKFACRYREYRLSFGILALLFVFAFTAGALLWSGLSLSSFGEGLIHSTRLSLTQALSGSCFFRSLEIFSGRLLTLFAVFLAGITVYSPLICAGAVSWWGLSGGVSLGFLFRFYSEGMSLWVLVSDVIFCFAGAALLCMYAAFVVCVSFKQLGIIPDAEDRIFGGTLFCGRFYKKRINLRFLLSYQFIFVGVSLGEFLLTLGYRWIMDLLVG